jgi:hypothetical protein
MWVKKSREQVFPQQPHKATEEDLELFLMPWMAANPSKSSSSFGDYPALHGAGVSLEACPGFFQGVPAACSGRA